MTTEDWEKLNVRKYASTAVGAYVSNFILGVRDRHEHNIMIVNDLEKDPKMMQIDFGFILMENPGGLALDTPRMTMPAPLVRRFEAEMVTVTNDDGTSHETTLMDLFQKDCLTAYVVLRRHQAALVAFVRNLLSGVYTRVQTVEAFMRGRHCFNSGLAESEASSWFERKLQTQLKTTVLRRGIKRGLYVVRVFL
jgi:hypothetical protein